MNIKKLIFILFLTAVPAVILLYGGNEEQSPVINGIPQRIVTLSPSIAREIADLGAESQLAGVTTFAPRLNEKIETVGTYINPDLEKIIRLKPDLVIMSDEDAYIQKISILKKFGLNTFVLGKNADFSSMCSNYITLAGIIGKREKALLKLADYKSRIAGVARGENPPGVVFLISVNPLVTVSGSSHISAIISDAGAINVFASSKGAYPIMSLESLVTSGADAVIVMTAGDDSFLYSRLSGYRQLSFISRRNIFVAGDENIPYYTPGDYAVSVEKIRTILNMINR